MTPEFKSFDDIKALAKMEMSITQKLHGTNAQIYVYQKEDGTLDALAGCRTRWIYPQDDNYGFAAFVAKNKEEIIAKLGLGRHDGEWAGPGINSGEGLTEKTFFLFAWWRWQDQVLPPQMRTVPLLYRGPVDLAKVDEVMADLKANGSKAAEGYMSPEGVVVALAGVRYKKVFKLEEVPWNKGPSNKGKNPKTFIDYTFLCQPIRLEKLLSRDQRYLREYPTSLGQIVKDYIADLVKENQIPGTEDEIRATQKACTGQVFKFIKTVADEIFEIPS